MVELKKDDVIGLVRGGGRVAVGRFDSLQGERSFSIDFGEFTLDFQKRERIILPLSGFEEILISPVDRRKEMMRNNLNAGVERIGPPEKEDRKSVSSVVKNILRTFGGQKI